MSDEAWKAIAQIAILIGVLAGLYNSIRNGRQGRKNELAIARTDASVVVVQESVADNTAITGAAAERLETIHGQMNGLKEELVRAVGAEKLAEGKAAGRVEALFEDRARVAESERVEDREMEKK